MTDEQALCAASVGASGSSSNQQDEAPLVFTPPPGNPPFPLFDGLRALAAITILIYHAASLSGYVQFGRLGAWATNLNVGVTIFFVISGFLLYRPYVRARLAGEDGPSLGRCVRARSAVVGLWFEIGLLALLSVASGFATYAWSGGATSPLMQGLPRFMFWFALGMGLALASAWVAQQEEPPRWVAALSARSWRCWAAALALFVVLGVLTRVPADGISFSPRTALLQWTLGGVIALLVALPAVFSGSPRSAGARILLWRPVVWLGLVSYGLFLWQAGPLLVIFDQRWISSGHMSIRFVEFALLATVMTIPLAALSYYVVERPFLRFKDPRQKQSPAR